MFRPTGFVAASSLWGVLLCLSGLSLAQAQQTGNGSGIYTCIDARGRTLTSDRPIPECTDREQKVLNPSGTVKARLSPTLTAQERAARDAQEKAAQEERARLNEEKRRDRALLARYPNQAVHDKERAQALAQIGVVRQAAAHRVKELLRQRALLNDEMAFYQKDPSKAPASLRRQVDELAQSLAIQGRFIADQESELKRVNARFDEELLRLKRLWPLQSAPAAASTPR